MMELLGLMYPIRQRPLKMIRLCITDRILAMIKVEQQHRMIRYQQNCLIKTDMWHE